MIGWCLRIPSINRSGSALNLFVNVHRKLAAFLFLLVLVRLSVLVGQPRRGSIALLPIGLCKTLTHSEVFNCFIESQSSFERISSWDIGASSYLIHGLDQFPGAAGVDDDGNGVVDDVSELGATGTDDSIVTPADGDAYAAAASHPSSRVVSYGAMLPIWSSDSGQSLQAAIEQLPLPLSFDWMPSTTKANCIAIHFATLTPLISSRHKPHSKSISPQTPFIEVQRSRRHPKVEPC